ncbi:hypothetical protein ACHAXR_011942 [Thalassiosira sp. AJA248-18]
MVGRSLSPSHFRYHPTTTTAATAEVGVEQQSTSSRMKLVRDVDLDPAQDYTPTTTNNNSDHHHHHHHPVHHHHDLTASHASSLLSHDNNSSRNDLKSSQFSLLSHDNNTTTNQQEEEEEEASSITKTKKKSKSKSRNKLWKVMKKGWKKHNGKDHHQNHDHPTTPQGTPPTTTATFFKNSHDHPQQPTPGRRVTPPNADESGRSGNTGSTAPPSPPPNNNDNNHHNGGDHRGGNTVVSFYLDDSIRSDDGTTEHNNDDDILGNEFSDSDRDPWHPTLSMLVTSGQLDCIESESEEEGSSVNIMEDEEERTTDANGGNDGDNGGGDGENDFENSDMNIMLGSGGGGEKKKKNNSNSYTELNMQELFSEEKKDQDFLKRGGGGGEGVVELIDDDSNGSHEDDDDDDDDSSDEEDEVGFYDQYNGQILKQGGGFDELENYGGDDDDGISSSGPWGNVATTNGQQVVVAQANNNFKDDEIIEIGQDHHDNVMDDSGRSGRSSKGGYDVDAFMDMPQTEQQGSDGGHEDDDDNDEGQVRHNDDDLDDSINEFFNQVASSYLHTVKAMDCDVSKAESTLSKEDTVYSRRKSNDTTDNTTTKKQNENNMPPSSISSPSKSSRNLSIKSFGESIVRRGRSRGRRRRKKEEELSTVAEDHSLSRAVGNEAVMNRDPSPIVVKVEDGRQKAKEMREAAEELLRQQKADEKAARADSSTNPKSRRKKAKEMRTALLQQQNEQKTDETAQNENSDSPSSTNVNNSKRNSRSRSLFRRRHMNILRKSLTKTKDQEEAVEVEKERHPPKRGSSYDIAEHRKKSNNNDDATAKNKNKRRTAQSLPRKISPLNDSHHSLLLFDNNSSLEYSDLLLHKRRRRKCLVCRQIIPIEEEEDGKGTRMMIRYMDFYFCSNGTCFRCTSCNCDLGATITNNENNTNENEEDEVDDGDHDDHDVRSSGIQIISNARGSIVECGECAKKVRGLSTTTEGLPLLSHDEVEGSLRGSSSLKQSIHFDDSDDPLMMAVVEESSHSNGGGGGGDHAVHLTRAAKRLAQKAAVKLNLVASSGRSSENEHLSSLYFMQSEENSMSISKLQHQQKQQQEDENSDEKNNLITKVLYELDSDAFGNPNYDGYFCSVTNFDDGQDVPPRTTHVALPKLTSDEIDGSISTVLEVDLQLGVDDDESSPSNCSVVDGILPRRMGPAMLSIEPFRSLTINKDTVMKVLRQTWEYKAEEENVTYKFTFVVPFKKIYISWEIDEGDELDLMQCQLEVTVEYDPPQEEEEAPEEPKKPVEEEVDEMGEPEKANVNLDSDHAIPVISTVNEVVHEDGEEDSLDVDSMPGEVYVKTLSIDSTVTTVGCPSSLILSRKHLTLDPDRDENDNFSELLSVASCINSIIALPSITYVKINKGEDDEEIGLSLIEKNGATVVVEVSKSGLFANSKIKEGCEILAINGQCVRGPRSVMRIMKDTVGKVLIIVSDSPSPPGSRFVVKKHFSMGLFGKKNSDSATNSQDITFEMINGLVRVRDISENGIFSESPISKGDIILSVDGVPALSDDVATRAMGRSQSIVAMLIFSLPDFWKSIVEFIIDEKYNRWWKRDSKCILLWGDEDCTSITLSFDVKSGLCKAEGNWENEIDLKDMNAILDRVMKLLTDSMQAYRTIPKARVRESSRSLSVTPSGRMMNGSDVYRRALIKLDEMRENGTISRKDYEAGRHALAQVAIQTAK